MPRSRDPFDDAGLYDWTYRRRRDDVSFYRTLAHERGGPVLDLGCGTGRLMVPLLRDGHVVAGVDRSTAMLSRAQGRLARLRPPLRQRALLAHGDMRALPFASRFAFAISAFHSVQHLHTDDDQVAGYRAVAATLIPGGWFAFDSFAPNSQFLARVGSRRRWGRTRFRHPVTGRPILYTESYRRNGQVLATTFHYQELDGRGRSRGAERRAVLRHRLLTPADVRVLLGRAGLTLIASWGGFDGRPLDETDDETEQHIFLAQRR